MSVMQTFKVYINEFLRFYKKYDMDDFTDNQQLSKNAKLFFRRTSKVFRKNRSTIIGYVNISEFKDIYPQPVYKALMYNNIKKMPDWFEDIDMVIGSDHIKEEIQFSFLSGLLWFYIVFELIKPILYLMKQANLQGTENYKTFGFSKSEMNRLSDLSVYTSVNISDFLKNETVTEQDVKKLEWYLQRLFRSAIYNRILDDEEKD